MPVFTPRRCWSGDRAVLIRGPSGAGESRLAFDLILAGRTGQVPPAFWSATTVFIWRPAAGVMVRPAPELAGLIEVRGSRHSPLRLSPQAVVGLVVDLDAAMPSGCRQRKRSRSSHISVLKYLESLWHRVFGTYHGRCGADHDREVMFRYRLTDDCLKGIGNHICLTTRDRIDPRRLPNSTVLF